MTKKSVGLDYAVQGMASSCEEFEVDAELDVSQVISM